MFSHGEEPIFHLLVPHHPLSPVLRACSYCGLTFEAFRNSSTVGCAGCYQSFSEAVYATVRQLHGSDQHCGKRPALRGEALAEEMKDCRVRLQEAIANENFEEAVVLRDRIREIRSELGDSSP